MPQLVSLESEEQINTATAGDQQLRVLATNASGAVLVSWLNYPAGSGPQTVAQVLETDGTPLGSVFALPDNAEATLFEDGTVGAVYLSSGVQFQRYDVNGSALGGPVNIAPTGSFQDVHIATLAGGGAVVGYVRTTGFNTDIFVRVLDSTYTPIGAAFTAGQNVDIGSDVTTLAGGEIVVRWIERFNSSTPVFPIVRHTQIWAPDGTEIDHWVEGNGGLESIEALPDGGFAMFDVGGLQIYNADGTPRLAAPVSIARGELAYVGNNLLLIERGTSGQLVRLDGVVLGEPFALTDGEWDSTGFTIVQGVGDTFVRLVELRDEGSGSNDDVGLQSWQLLTDNIVIGTPNADNLSGIGGDKVLVGLAGDDQYTVDGDGDYVQEVAGGGFDRVFSSADYNLDDDAAVEELATTNDAGTAAIYLVGNAFTQTIRGNNGSNSLLGKGGGDTLIGLGGNDLIYLAGASDIVVEAVGGGVDRVYAPVNYVLGAGQEVEILAATDMTVLTNLDLTGNEFAQQIYGTEGRNVLDSGGGGDVLRGFGGADTYIIRDSHDSVREAASGSNGDRVLAAADFTLGAGQYIEIIETLDPAATAPLRLAGNEFVQEISGNAGANVLTGGGGADVMRGFAGDDWYYVSDTGTVIGGENGSGGNDRLLTSVSFSLSVSAMIEKLTTTDNLGTQAIDLTGNALANQQLYGNAGSNRLNGNGGGDYMAGLEGDDRYVVSHAGDVIAEKANGGSDRALVTVDYRLNAGAVVEIVSTYDNLGTEAIDLTGNELGQFVYGNAGNNVLDGGHGRDTLVGMGGADSFLFSTSLNTAFVPSFASVAPTGNVDRIFDFGVDDKILLDGDLFGLTPGALPAGAFNTGSVATEADDRILFDAATRALLFDGDGAGGSAALLIAFIDNPFNLDASYIAVV